MLTGTLVQRREKQTHCVIHSGVIAEGEKVTVIDRYGGPARVATIKEVETRDFSLGGKICRVTYDRVVR